MSFYERVKSEVCRIPRGKVATYGQIAALAGNPRAARMVGWALHALEKGARTAPVCPWWRVVNARGILSTTCREHPPALQKGLLEKDGVRVKRRSGAFCVSLKEYGWNPLEKQKR